MYMTCGDISLRWLCTAVTSRPPAKRAGHDGRHLGVEQDEIAHHHRVIADLLERRVRAEREPGLDRNALDGDVEIGPRHPDPKHVAGLQLAGLPSACSTAFQSDRAAYSADGMP
jgi:hypothetical protein